MLHILKSKALYFVIHAHLLDIDSAMNMLHMNKFKYFHATGIWCNYNILWKKYKDEREICALFIENGLRYKYTQDYLEQILVEKYLNKFDDIDQQLLREQIDLYCK